MRHRVPQFFVLVEMSKELDELFDRFCEQEATRSEVFCSVQSVLALYQENPFLLDRKLESYINRLQELIGDSFTNQADKEQTCILSFKLIHLFISTRGKRVVALFLRHDLPNVWLLKHLKESLVAPEWQVQFVSFLWLSQFLLLPFGFVNDTPYSKSFFDSCLEIGHKSLYANTPVQKAAGLFLGVAYSRPEYDILTVLSASFQDCEQFVSHI